MDGQMDRRTNRWMDGWMEEWMYFYKCSQLIIMKSSLFFPSTQIFSNPSVQLDSLDQTKELKRVKLVSSPDEKFFFSSLVNPVEFISCSARGKGDENNCTPEINKISKWLNTVSL